MINGRAVFFGVLVAVTVSTAVMVLSLLLQFRAGGSVLPYLSIGVRFIGIVGKIAGGGLAGWMAGRAGALHGALSMSIAMLISLAIGTCVSFGLGGSAAYLGNLDYWATFLQWAALGIAIGAASGYVAEKARPAR